MNLGLASPLPVNLPSPWEYLFPHSSPPDPIPGAIKGGQGEGYGERRLGSQDTPAIPLSLYPSFSL